MSQITDVIEYIRDHGSITSRQAIFNLGCYRLASRINDMRKGGIPVESEMITVPAHNGKNTRIARYTIPGGVPECFKA